MAHGDVVGWLNADDLYLENALEQVSRAFAANRTAEWVTGPCRIVDQDGQEMRGTVTRYKGLFLRRYRFGLHLVQNFVAAPATFVRRSVLNDLGGLDERFDYSMDYDLWLKLGRRGAPIVIDEPLAVFRMAEGSLSMSGFERQFREHAANAREHGEGHRAAVIANAAASRLIVLAYRVLRRLRA
jgi:GT2 family glycosyltransferase